MNPTEQQGAVVRAHHGIVLVKACPGSGKTATLVQRCKALPASETKLVLAFNKKAAEEFSARLGSVPGADVRTFHSFCFREVMRNPKAYGFRGKPTLSEGTLFRSLCEASGKKIYGWDESGWDEDFIREAEHSMHNEELEAIIRNPPQIMLSLRRKRYTEAPEVASAKALLLYREWLQDKNLVTFDSMVRLVAENAGPLTIAGQHVMIDEYQDVDRFQFDITVALAKIPGVKSLVCVGDPNQTIYTWRGALHDSFSDMARAFPQSNTLPLTMNFRSFDEILEHAETICRVGMKGVRGKKSDAVLHGDPTDEDIKAVTGGFPLDKSAILCRYNRDCAKWHIGLARRGIPVYLIGKSDFWNLKHIKMAKQAWEQKMTFSQFIMSDQWIAMLEKKKFRDDPDLVEEVTEDARFILGLNEKDMDIIESNLQREDGIKISTIHKTKGLEFDSVMVSGVTERLKRETFLYYVAVTRAKNRLVLA